MEKKWTSSIEQSMVHKLLCICIDGCTIYHSNVSDEIYRALSKITNRNLKKLKCPDQKL